MSEQTPTLSFEEIKNAQELTFKFSGRMDLSYVTPIWETIIESLEEKEPQKVILDVEQLNYCDVAGTSLLLEVKRRQLERNAGFEVQHIPDNLKAIFEIFEDLDPYGPQQKEEKESLVEELGKSTYSVFEDMYIQISFRGELVTTLISSLLNPRSIRWKDTFMIAEKAGANALGIVALVGGLLGLILAFQSATFMKQYGAEVFVANLVGLSIIRELGPLMTAIILAGRTGSAFAAELGTMKVNEELDALETMGLNPVRFLIVPRVIAAVCIMPFLTLFANFFGLLGGAFVVLSFGYPFSTYLSQVQSAVGLPDLFSGLFKATVFGFLVAQVGCMRGMQTKSGAGAVGDSATSAVVTSIVMIAIWDGVFAVLFYYMGI